MTKSMKIARRRARIRKQRLERRAWLLKVEESIPVRDIWPDAEEGYGPDLPGPIDGYLVHDGIDYRETIDNVGYTEPVYA